MNTKQEQEKDICPICRDDLPDDPKDVFVVENIILIA